MNSHSGNQDKDYQGIDEAWAKLQGKLISEPVNPVWAIWDQKLQTRSEQVENIWNDGEKTEGGLDSEQTLEQRKLHATENNPIKHSQRMRMSRGRKWGIAVASVAVITIVLATPIGNTAMASLLNQFRMEEATVVDEGDLRNMFNQVTENGTLGTMNKFGEFSSRMGAINGELPVEKMQETLGYSPLKGALPEEITTAYVSPSQEITLKLNVNEVNNTMKRLGANQLLPDSVDGKPITLHIPEVVLYDLSTDQEKWANLTQMNTPAILVDPSIKVEEAIGAVINFPLLPDYLKSSLQRSRILTGEIPMPLIKGQNAEQITMNDTSVIIEQYTFSEGVTYKGTWVQDRQLFELQGGTLFSSKEQFLEKLQELIH